MNFEFEKAFVRDFRKLKNKELASSIVEVIKQVSEAVSPNEIINLKKLDNPVMLTPPPVILTPLQE